MLELQLEFRVNLGQTEIDYHAALCVRIVEEVARLYVAVVYTQILQVLKTDQQLVNVVLHLFDRESVEEGLSEE